MNEAKEILKIAKELIAAPNFLRILRKKNIGFGAYSWDGKVDGVNVTVVRNPADMSIGTGFWWDIQVGTTGAIQTPSRGDTSERDVNQIIDKMLKAELKHKKEMSSGPLSLSKLRSVLKDMHLDISLNNSAIDRISKAVYKKMSEMDEGKLSSMRRRGRMMLIDAEDENDEEGMVIGALTLVYAKSLLKMF
jgi:hypothetical protein